MSRKVSIGLLFVLLLATFGAAGAAGEFVEPEVEVLYKLTGDGGFYYGWVASRLGDISGDGVEDFLVTDLSINGFGGRVYVYSGADASLLATHTGDPATLLGYSARFADDVNMDGVDDYIAGAYWGDRALVYSGADHTVLHDVSGDAGSLFGSGTAGVGDLNGDGYGDFIVGAAAYGADGNGRVYVYSGADGSLIRTHTGEANSSLGSAVGKIGDVNEDGVADYVAGASTGGPQGRGEAFAYSGATGETLFTMKPVGLPNDNGSTFAVFFATGAGDVNGDGTPDIFIGDYAAKQGNVSGTGKAYIFSGKNGQLIRLMKGENKGDGFGPGRGIGDINGDGRGDIIVAGYTNSDGAPSAGKTYLISGKNGRTLRTMTGTEAALSLGVDALPLGDLNGDGLLDYGITGSSFTAGQSGVMYIVAGIPH